MRNVTLLLTLNTSGHFSRTNRCVCVGVAEEGQKCSVEGDDGSVLLQVKEKRDNFAESK